MELVDKWEIEGKIHDANRNNINRYFELFEEHIAPKSNALIVIMELKRLFQGSMSLEDFHTKALRLVKEAEYPERDTWNRVIRDTIISGLASDRIHAKIIKEGKDVTLPQVIKIVHLEVSNQRHIDRMQETAKVNYVHYGKGSKRGKPKSSGKGLTSGGSGSSWKPSKPSGKGRKVPLPTDICWRCGEGRHQKGQPCKAVEAVQEMFHKGHYEKVCMKGKSNFPDNSIFRRTRSMIKPQSQPSYFELEAEGKDRNSSGHIPAKSQHTFNSNLQTPEIPALPMASLVLPSLTSKATLIEQGQISTSSTDAAITSSSSKKSSDPVVPTTQKWSTYSTKGIPPVRFPPTKKWLCVPMEHYGSQWKGSFHVHSVCVGLI